MFEKGCILPYNKHLKRRSTIQIASSLTALMDTKAYQQMLQTSKQHSEFIHELEVHEQTTILYESLL